MSDELKGAVVELAKTTQTLVDLQAKAVATVPVNAVSVKLSGFWTSNPEPWFAQAEAVFATRNPAITQQKTKFDYVIQSLDSTTSERVQSIILRPPQNPYDALKSALISTFGKTQAVKDQDLLDLSGLGDRKPSELLQHMKNLNTDRETLFKALFLAQLPPDVRSILALSSKTDIGDLALEADRITEVSKLSNEAQVNATRGAQSSRSNTRNKADDWHTLPGMCKFHSRFGTDAKRCISPCKLYNKSDQGNDRAGRR